MASEFESFRQEYRDGQKEQIELLREISRQSEQINGHTREISEVKKDTKEAFNRIRAIELAPGRSAGKAFWIMVTAISGGVGSLVVGLFLVYTRSQLGS